MPALTINKVCLSGIDAIALADQLIRAGEFDAVVAGGQESMSRVVAQHIVALALKTGEERVDIGMAEHVVRRGSRNTGCNTGQVGGSAVGRRIGHRDRGATK